MVFDAHHHVIREKLDTYEHDSVRFFTEQAKATWPDPAWQVVHISNGHASFADPKHSELITVIPSAFHDVPWIEVEAKSKELAIRGMRRGFAR
jgi:UV DNA damage endonuclease